MEDIRIYIKNIVSCSVMRHEALPYIVVCAVSIDRQGSINRQAEPIRFLIQMKCLHLILDCG